MQPVSILKVFVMKRSKQGGDLREMFAKMRRAEEKVDGGENEDAVVGVDVAAEEVKEAAEVEQEAPPAGPAHSPAEKVERMEFRTGGAVLEGIITGHLKLPNEAQQHCGLTDVWKAPLGYRWSKEGYRTFQQRWFVEHKWLRWVPGLRGAFCGTCVIFEDHVARQGGRQPQPHTQLVRVPLTRFKKAKEKLMKHEKTQTHQACAERAAAFLHNWRNPDSAIDRVLDDQRKSIAAANRKKLGSVVETLLFLGRNGLPLRGKKEESSLLEEGTGGEGVFRNLLRFRIQSGDTGLTDLVEGTGNAKYTSPDIQNDLIDCIQGVLLDTLKAKFQRAGHYATLMDETTDVSRKEQASVVIRTISADGDISEDFVGFLEAENTTGRGLATLLVNRLNDLNLELSMCRGQGYDGAAAMSGQFKGCQAHLTEQEPLAIYVHCSAHRLNLALSTSVKVPPLRNFFGTVSMACNFVLESPKRVKKLESLIEDGGDSDVKRRRLVRYCATRWVERHEAVSVFVELLPYVIKLLEAVEGDLQAEATANGILNAIRSGAFLVSMVTADDLLGITLPLSRRLQDPSTHLGQALGQVDQAVQFLKNARGDAEKYFSNLFAKAERIAEELQAEIIVPRKSDRQTHRMNVPAETPMDHYRLTIFIPYLDHLITQLEDRFRSRPDILQAQGLIPQWSEVGTLSKLLPVLEAYEKDLPDTKDQAEREVKLWLHHIGGDDPQTKALCLTGCVKRAKEMGLDSVVTLLRLYGTVPCTTASVERSFSRLRNLKTHLRNKMGEERLSGLALMAIHPHIPIDIDKVLDRFKASGNRRILL